MAVIGKIVVMTIRTYEFLGSLGRRDMEDKECVLNECVS